MRNVLKANELLDERASPEVINASKIKFSKMEKWLDKAVDNELRDTLVSLRKMDIRKEQESYEETLTFFLAKYFKDTGAQAIKSKIPGNFLPDIKFSKLNHRAQDVNLSSSPFGTDVKLATYDSPLLTYNNMIIGMYDQITPTNASPIMMDFPSAMYPAVGLYIASWSAIRGMTQEHQNGQPFATVKKRDVDYQFYKTEPFAEKVVWHQEEVIGLRQPDSNSFMERGLPIYTAKNTAMVEHRRQTRDIFNIYRAVYDGIVYYNGNALSYNINPANRLTGTQLGGAPWATFSSTGIITSFGAVNVLQALRNLAHAVLRKYVGRGLRFLMNSLTLSAIIGNSSITPVTNFGTGVQVGSGKAPGDEKQLESILRQFLGTNVNIDIVIDDSQYLADDKDPLGRTAGVDYYLNDVGKIAIFPQVQDTGAGMGEYAYTPIVQNGGMYNPQPGVAFFTIDTFASNTTEGMENPSLSQALRFSAIPLIFRNNDLFTLDITQ